MLTPDKNFRMKPAFKTMLALTKFKDAHDRGAFKRAMIDAQLCEEAAKRAALKSKDTGAGGDNKGRSRGAVAPE
jgi:hypothetical protein